MLIRSLTVMSVPQCGFVRVNCDNSLRDGHFSNLPKRPVTEW